MEVNFPTPVFLHGPYCDSEFKHREQMADAGMLKTSGSELECFADYDFSLVERV